MALYASGDGVTPSSMVTNTTGSLVAMWLIAGHVVDPYDSGDTCEPSFRLPLSGVGPGQRDCARAGADQMTSNIAVAAIAQTRRPRSAIALRLPTPCPPRTRL